VKAVLLIVDSPGGTVTGSDVLYEEIKAFRKSGKKVVTLVRSLAASGGYYVAAGSDHIICHRTGITGSIGVIWPHLNVSRLLDEKLLISYEPIKSTKMKDIGSMTRAMTPEERKILQDVVADAHNRFVEVVAEGRELNEAEAAALANGSIFTAQQALDNRLIDEIGYYADAIAATRRLAGLGRCRVVRYKKRPTPLDILLGVSASRPSGSPLEYMLPGSPMYLWRPGLPVQLSDLRHATAP
jgi:protease-4